MSQEQPQKDALTLKDTATKLLEKLHHEVDLASKIFSTTTSEFNNSIQESVIELTTLFNNFTKIVDKIEEQNLAMTHEFRTFALLPEKIATSIAHLAPQIAAQVETIHEPRMVKITDDLMLFKKQLTDDVSNSQNRLEVAANKFMQDVDILSKQKNILFFKNLAFVVLFSAVVSSVTSYTVATHFPRYVEIKGINNLSVYDSKVEVWGAKTIDAKKPTDAKNNDLER